MTNTEIVLTVVVVFYQVTLWAVLVLQKSINKTLKETIEILLERTK